MPTAEAEIRHRGGRSSRANVSLNSLVPRMRLSRMRAFLLRVQRAPTFSPARWITPSTASSPAESIFPVAGSQVISSGPAVRRTMRRTRGPPAASRAPIAEPIKPLAPVTTRFDPGRLLRSVMSTQPHLASRMLRQPCARPVLFVLLLMPSSCMAQEPARASLPTCTFQRISDGDSFRCADGRRIRLIGIDSPELQQQPFGPQAQRALLALLPLGATVRLETDASQRDRFGRELAYVWTGTTLVNEVLVREGWAVLYTVPPNV